MFNLPIYFTNTYKTKPDKTFLVGMNWFRNAHYHEQNKVKTHYHELIGDIVPHLARINSQYSLNIDLYYKNPTCDGSNISALMEKFVLDALQEFKVVTQDNVKFHIGTTWSVIEQDRDNPRCEITIQPKDNDGN